MLPNSWVWLVEAVAFWLDWRWICFALLQGREQVGFGLEKIGGIHVWAFIAIDLGCLGRV
jgi:hypothetical protein